MVSKIKLIRLILKIIKEYKKDPEKMKKTSISQYCDENIHDGRLKRFLTMSSASMQVNPFIERSSMGELVSNIIEVIKKKSVFYPEGGWNDFFLNLQSVIQKNDGEIRLKSEVSHIIIKNGVAIGVEVNGKFIRSNYVISTIPVQNLFNILDRILF